MLDIIIKYHFILQKRIIAFYTDFHSSHNVFKIFEIIPRIFYQKKFKRISNRKLPYGLPKKLVKDNLYNIFLTSLNGFLMIFLKELNLKNFLNANSIYTNIINSDIELLKDAKKKVYISFMRSLLTQI